MINRFFIIISVFLVVSLNAKSVEEIFFENCANCHGEDGSEKALGVSKDMTKMSQKEIVIALKEYKAGRKNEAGLGSTMQNVVANMDEEKFKALAKYIKTLK